MKKITSLLILISFVVSCVMPPQGFAQTLTAVGLMSIPGTPVTLSSGFMPAFLKGMALNATDPFKFDFIIYRGDESLTNEQKQAEYPKLIKYFLAALAVPDEDQWVNLSPYEKDRIIPDSFGLTEMGRDLLAQDYLLKQLSASLSNPDTDLGKKFWDSVYEQAYQKFGSTEVSSDTFNKVWIVPDRAVVYEKGNTVYVLENHLKVMMEKDYLATKANDVNTVALDEANNATDISHKVMSEVILPAIEKEVNEGKNFAPLRQVYSGMLLATWYKRSLKESILGKLYADKAKVKGIDQDPKNNQEIYTQYVAAFKKGVFNMIKEDVDRYTREVIPRKYFSGGMEGYGKLDLVQAPVLPATVNSRDALNLMDVATTEMRRETTDRAQAGVQVDRALDMLEQGGDILFELAKSLRGRSAPEILEKLQASPLRGNVWVKTAIEQLGAIGVDERPDVLALSQDVQERLVAHLKGIVQNHLNIRYGADETGIVLNFVDFDRQTTVKGILEAAERYITKRQGEDEQAQANPNLVGVDSVTPARELQATLQKVTDDVKRGMITNLPYLSKTKTNKEPGSDRAQLTSGEITFIVLREFDAKRRKMPVKVRDGLKELRRIGQDLSTTGLHGIMQDMIDELKKRLEEQSVSAQDRDDTEGLIDFLATMMSAPSLTWLRQEAKPSQKYQVTSESIAKVVHQEYRSIGREAIMLDGKDAMETLQIKGSAMSREQLQDFLQRMIDVLKKRVTEPPEKGLEYLDESNKKSDGLLIDFLEIMKTNPPRTWLDSEAPIVEQSRVSPADIVRAVLYKFKVRGWTTLRMDDDGTDAMETLQKKGPSMSVPELKSLLRHIAYQERYLVDQEFVGFLNRIAEVPGSFGIYSWRPEVPERYEPTYELHSDLIGEGMGPYSYDGAVRTAELHNKESDYAQTAAAIQAPAAQERIQSFLQRPVDVGKVTDITGRMTAPFFDQKPSKVVYSGALEVDMTTFRAAMATLVVRDVHELVPSISPADVFPAAARAATDITGYYTNFVPPVDHKASWVLVIQTQTTRISWLRTLTSPSALAALAKAGVMRAVRLLKTKKAADSDRAQAGNIDMPRLLERVVSAASEAYKKEVASKDLKEQRLNIFYGNPGGDRGSANIVDETRERQALDARSEPGGALYEAYKAWETAIAARNALLGQTPSEWGTWGGKPIEGASIASPLITEQPAEKDNPPTYRINLPLLQENKDIGMYLQQPGPGVFTLGNFAFGIQQRFAESQMSNPTLFLSEDPVHHLVIAGVKKVTVENGALVFDRGSNKVVISTEGIKVVDASMSEVEWERQQREKTDRDMHPGWWAIQDAKKRQEEELLGPARVYERDLEKRRRESDDAQKPASKSTDLGGIDMNSANLNLLIKRDGNGMPLPVSQQNLDGIRIDGLVPVILDIRPASAALNLS